MKEAEKEFWAKVSLTSALGDILGFDSVRGLVGARIPLPRIIDMAALECFMHPEKLGVRRHTERIRKILIHFENGGYLTEEDER